jgi:hypothetical protein
MLSYRDEKAIGLDSIGFDLKDAMVTAKTDNEQKITKLFMTDSLV